MSDQNPLEALKALEAEAVAAAEAAEDGRALEEVRVTYLGRKDGRISLILRGLGQMSAEERPAVGQEANRVKSVVSDALEAREQAMAGPVQSSGADLTLPSDAPWRGALHPITQTVDSIWEIFRDLGFTRARGPEADTE